MITHLRLFMTADWMLHRNIEYLLQMIALRYCLYLFRSEIVVNMYGHDQTKYASPIIFTFLHS